MQFAYPLWGLLLLLDPTEQPRPKLEAEPSIDLNGYWECRGIDGGKPYRGIVSIERKGGVYVVSWSVGGNSFTGIGLSDGSTLSVAWAVPMKDGIVRGLNVYKIAAGKLTGRWATLPGPGEPRPETMTFIKAFAKDVDDE